MIVLLGQNLGGGHQGGHVVVLEGDVAGRRRHHRLAGADIALHQAVHRRVFGKVLPHLVDGTLLRPGEGEGQLVKKGLQIGFSADREDDGEE